MNTTAYLKTWFNPSPALPITEAALIRLGVPLSAIEAGEMRGDIVTRGAWQIPVSYRALCMSTVYTPKDKARYTAQADSKTAHGVRVMTGVKQSGYALEGWVSIAGKNYSAFTSSQLFKVSRPDGSLKLVSIAVIVPRIPDSVEKAEIMARRSAGLL